MNNDILSVDFGSHEGKNDVNLKEYFLDDSYIQSIINENTYFVIGRKGTGKSALCTWFKIKEIDENYLCNNLSLDNFPSNKLLSLNDEDYPATSQYQNIWRYTILCELSKMITQDPLADVSHPAYRSLLEYLNCVFGEDLVDIQRKVTQVSTKINGVLSVLHGGSAGVGFERQKSYTMDEYDHIESVNLALLRQIESYLTDVPFNRKIRYLIQFDGLDDNYVVLSNEKYFNLIISLFKCIYNLNNYLIPKEFPIKIIAYLRSDIYNEFSARDVDSAKWELNKYDLRWAVINREDFRIGALRKMINLRIKKSLNTDVDDPWSLIFDNKKINLLKKGNLTDTFEFVINNTMHRPRDLVMFCKFIQIETKKRGFLDYRTCKQASREFARWLWTELSNEFNQEFNPRALKQFLLVCGNRCLSMGSFEKIYKNYCERQHNFEFSVLEFLEKLYMFGIIVNTDGHGNYYSIVRNESSSFNRNHLIIINQCLRKCIFEG